MADQGGGYLIRFGCLLPGLTLIAISLIGLTVTGATEVWGDALPWIMLEVLGFFVTVVGAIVCLIRYRRRAGR